MNCPSVDELSVGQGWDEPCEVVADAAFKFTDELPYGHPPDPWDTSLTTLWNRMLWSLIYAISPNIRQRVQRIAINGTSATMLISNWRGHPAAYTEPLTYNDTSARDALSEVAAIAPPNSPVLSATSTLTKALWLYRRNWPPMQQATEQQATEQQATPRNPYIAHQADFLARYLHHKPGITDYHNALKLGYDVKTRAYPDWLLRSPIGPWLPEVIAPGEVIGPVHPQIAENAGFPRDCLVCAGTTDSIAAFLASGARFAGEAVTSLGSTLVIKLLSSEPIDDQAFGIYSHRLGDLWLAGGASNTGGAVLSQFFSSEQLGELSAQIDPTVPCNLNYYPLNRPGERFPINDPDYPPQLEPRPECDRDFLYGLLSGIANIEANGYRKLQNLGAPVLQRVYTAGGGAQNKTWQAIRQQKLGVEVVAAEHTEAAFGTALLAIHGLNEFI